MQNLIMYVVPSFVLFNLIFMVVDLFERDAIRCEFLLLCVMLRVACYPKHQT
jgi:hypothetical protein